jgi:hypothetical protein
MGPSTRPLTSVAVGRSFVPPPPHVPPVAREGVPRGIQIAIRVTLSALTFAGGWFAVDFLFGSSFPDRIGAEERIEGESAEDLERLVDDAYDVLGLEAEVAFYGEAETPEHFVAIVSLPDGKSVEEVWEETAQRSGVPIPPLPVATRGPDFGCIDVTSGTGGASCMWLEEERFVEVHGFAATSRSLVPFARKAREEMT